MAKDKKDKPNKYRLHGKCVFLTYPQCPATREVLAAKLHERGSVLKAVIGREQHQDGEYHLHAYAKYDKAIDTINPRHFDLTYEGKDYHGKYELAKSGLYSIKYCIKEDKEPLQIGDMDAQQEVAAKENKKKIIGKRMQEEDLVDIVEEHPELMFDLVKLAANVQLYKQLKTRQKPNCGDFIPNTWDILIPHDDASVKQRHWWFWSTKPNQGKTKFLENIDRTYRASWYNKAELYQNIHADSQFILIDEYTVADIKATNLNSMCDGNYQYPVKGGTATAVKATILLCGNKNPEQLYPNAWQYIHARFNVVCLDKPEVQPNPFAKEDSQPEPDNNNQPQVEWPSILRN